MKPMHDSDCSTFNMPANPNGQCDCSYAGEMAAKYARFEKELEVLLNMHSMESESNTPDYALAGYLVDCLKALDNLSWRKAF